MPIGNPVTLTSNVASKAISVTATASQTLFNVTGGYRINELGVFKNGLRLQDGVDYTARDGLTVTLLSAASGGDKLQFVVFDTFRVAEAIRPAVDEQTIRGNLNVVGILSCLNLEGPVSLNITSGIQTFHDVRVGGALTVAGSLTYEDTTNTNTTGIATFSGGMNISGVGATITTLNVTGVSTFASLVDINDYVTTSSGLDVAGAGSTTTTLNVTGVSTFGGNVDLGDNDRLRLGAGNDLQIFHDGSNSFVSDQGTGQLQLISAGSAVEIKKNTGEAMGLFKTDGAVELYYDNSKKFETGPAGTITVGVSTADGFDVGDNEYITVGVGSDLAIYHDTTNSYIKSNTNELKIAGKTRIVNNSNTESIALFNPDGSVDLFYDNDLHFATTSDGCKTNGDLSFRGDGDVEQILFDASDASLKFTDNKRAKFGNGDDLQIVHGGTNSAIENYTGTLFIDQHVDDGDINIRSDNSSGGVTNYILCDGSSGAVILNHYGSEKFTTTSSGVEITGTLNATADVQINGKSAATTGKAIAMALIFG